MTDSMVATAILMIRRTPTRSSAELAAAVRRVEEFARGAARLGVTRWASPPPGTAVRTAVLMFLLTFAGLVFLVAGLSQ